MKVIKIPYLPIQETVLASDLETREEIRVPTGNLIHVLHLEGSLFVSEEVYEYFIHLCNLKKIAG